MADLKIIGDDLTGLIDDIRRIDNNDELKVVWDAMKNQWNKNTENALSKFYVGQDVVSQFRNYITKKDVFYNAKVIKINSKTVKIQLTDEFAGEQYNVDPRYLTEK